LEAFWEERGGAAGTEAESVGEDRGERVDGGESDDGDSWDWDEVPFSDEGSCGRV